MVGQHVAGPRGSRAIFESTASRGQWAASSQCVVVHGPSNQCLRQGCWGTSISFIYFFWAPAAPTAVAGLRPSEPHYPSKHGVSGADTSPWGCVAVRREDMRTAGPSPVWLQKWGKIQLRGSHNQDWMGNLPWGSRLGKAGAGPGFP